MENQTIQSDEYWMRIALEQAKAAEILGEVPVGAVIVSNHSIVAMSGNRRESEQNPLAHAECLALSEAAKKLGRWRLTGCTMYVTLEPCVMCAGGIVLARIDRVVYGAKDPKTGAVDSGFEILRSPRLNHSPAVESGVLAQECGAILTEFFRRRRT